MNTKDKVFVLLEEFKNELKTRLDTIYDLRQVRIAAYKEFQERYDTWYYATIEEAYVNWRERQDKSLAKKIAETGNEYTIEGYRWKVSFPGDRRSDTLGELVDRLGHELFPTFGDDFKLSDMAILQQWSNLVKIYVSKTGDRELTGLVEVLEIALDTMRNTLDARIAKLRDAVVIAEYEQSNLEEKCKKAMRPHYKKYHDELRRIVGELCDNGKEDFAFTLSSQMIWEDFNIWYNDVTKSKRNLDEVVKYLELAKKVL